MLYHKVGKVISTVEIEQPSSSTSSYSNSTLLFAVESLTAEDEYEAQIANLNTFGVLFRTFVHRNKLESVYIGVRCKRKHLCRIW